MLATWYIHTGAEFVLWPLIKIKHRKEEANLQKQTKKNKNLPMNSMDGVRFIMVSSFLVTHVNWQRRMEGWKNVLWNCGRQKVVVGGEF